jgi:hypothetical protein
MRELEQRAEAELARCNAALLAAHSHLCESIAVRLADRLPPARVVELYCHAHELAPLDEAWVRLHVQAHAAGAWANLHQEDADGLRGAWTALRDAMRVRVAPLGDPALQEILAYEFAHAGAVLLKIHVRNAITFAQALGTRVAGPAAIAQYVRRVELPAGTAGALYSLALSRIGQERYLAPPREHRELSSGPAPGAASVRISARADVPA